MNRRDIHIPVGELYDANYDERLIQARLDCQDLCHRFNQLFPSQVEEQESLLGEILGKKGKGVVVVSPFYCDYGSNVEIGDRSFLNTGWLRHTGRSQGDNRSRCVRGPQLRFLYGRTSLGYRQAQ